MRKFTVPAVASLFAIAAVLSTSSALAHDPEEAPSGHEHPEGAHDGVYNHGQDDGHHHHPHAHQPAPAPAPTRRSPYRYGYQYTPSHGYNYNTKPRVIEGWEPGDPVPDGYRPDTMARKGLVKGGAATLFSVYGLTAIVGSFFVVAEDIDAEDGIDGNGVDPEDYYPLFVPVIGPFITIGTAGTDRLGSALLVVNGIAQGAGLAMFVAGLAAQKDVLVRIPTYGTAVVEVKPVISKDFQGVGVDGTF